ncbi:chloramphenicol acetyltransferase [Levilactobacillus tangyuanensis]|uniref:Chloramphenicol acetyltransferase n=1 Tax=Levilactobacillus tangyuanensis TaxID=2486021 RepID=A0ABW1TP73_9LACO|nr:chloramphenicol acetyltransferase [Levilactobacillus tangyuanensis]
MTELNTTSHPIDQATWSRRESFYYFTKMMPTGFTINVEIDVTATKHWLAARQLKFNPAYLYLASRVIAEIPELRVGRNEAGELVHFDVLHPSYTIFHGDDHSISSLWTAYDAQFEQFYANYLADQETYGDQHTPMPKAPRSANTYMIGSLPWTHFTSYTPLPFGPLNTFFPVIQAGKFVEDGQHGWQMPVSVTIHHAVADGYHVSQFFERLQTVFDHPETYLA